MNGRDWFVGSIVTVAAITLALPPPACAEDRRFTSLPLDINRSYRIIYAPVVMARLGSTPVSEVPEVLATWTDLRLEDEGQTPDSSPGGSYRLVGINEKRDPARPTDPPEIDVVIEQRGRISENAPPPRIALIDMGTRLQVEATAEVFRDEDEDRVLYRVEVTPPRAALVPPGRRVYLNPADRYEVQLLGGIVERVAGFRQTLPTFGGPDPREQSTVRPRRRR